MKSNLPFAFALCLAAVGLDASAESPPPAPAPTEPAKPAGQEKPKATPPPIKQISETEYELNGIRINAKDRTIQFEGKLNMVRGMLEYALSNEKGSLHEALLGTTISPYDLNISLLLLDAKPAEGFFYQPDPERPFIPADNPDIAEESKLDIRLQWKNDKGEEKTAGLEEWISNRNIKGTLKPGRFAFTGSVLWPDGQLAAQATGNIMGLFCDIGSLINVTREEGIAVENLDENWEPAENLPPKDTPVKITFKLLGKATSKPIKESSKKN